MTRSRSATRVLITGASGLVGSELMQRIDGSAREVVGLSHAALDIADRDAVEQAMGAVLPDVVINCAAMADVDRCEREPEVALRVNAIGPRNLAIATARIGAHLVHISTDYVFSGDTVSGGTVPGDKVRQVPYDEWDVPSPVSTYGRSKLGGEHEVMRHATSWAVVRTSLVFGAAKPTFVDLVAQRARAGEEVRAATDMVTCPTSAADLAGVLERIGVERREGLFHVANQGWCSRYELACEVVDLLGLDSSVVRATTAAELQLPAARPPFSAMSDVALRNAGIQTLRHYREPLAKHVGSARRAATGHDVVEPMQRT